MPPLSTLIIVHDVLTFNIVNEMLHNTLDSQRYVDLY